MRHHGVIVFITNPDKSQFYIQQKDEKYPVKKYRLKYSLFGGEVEEGEDKESALERELNEELDERAKKIVLENATYMTQLTVMGKHPYDLSIFESILPNSILKRISKYPVKEGKRGYLANESEMRKLPFIHRLENAIHLYLI